MLLAWIAVACLWDSETLKEESLRQKDVAEIINGRIMKHSPYFYEEKVTYTKAKIGQGSPKPELFDDLAVALHKLGRTDEAIAVMEDKRTRFGEAYTTASNLGTFYADKGEIARGLELLKKSVELNPKAHFGREKYQIQILEYLQKLKDEPELDEKQDALGLKFDDERSLRFADQYAQPKETAFAKAGLGNDVFVALAGLIRFGSADQSPHVWCALGMALAFKGDRNLALAAFNRAEKLGHPRAMRLASVVIQQIKLYRDRRWPEVAQYYSELWRNGDAWVKQEQTKEDALLKKGAHAKVFGY